ncbi:AIS_HP2_G0015660.mRNA.1.CDS.1 [Saccharomyces cerevisiae]|nr:AIS_HP2_G0015660.mRNA.1.CDS.1 [Saccharomyces cerevisiae]CAI6483161.1 AIS_HP2_G0015660.mRNA.1.CDS.1 [Saccharomyces cerevisiae]
MFFGNYASPDGNSQVLDNIYEKFVYASLALIKFSYISSDSWRQFLLVSYLGQNFHGLVLHILYLTWRAVKWTNSNSVGTGMSMYPFRGKILARGIELIDHGSFQY